jgi:hypothetical protein
MMISVVSDGVFGAGIFVRIRTAGVFILLEK